MLSAEMELKPATVMVWPPQFTTTFAVGKKPTPEMIGNRERLIIDYFVIWRVTDPLLFLQTYPGGSHQAEVRIQKTVKALVGNTIGKMTKKDLLERSDLIRNLDDRSRDELSRTGVDIVDVDTRLEIRRFGDRSCFVDEKLPTERKVAAARSLTTREIVRQFGGRFIFI